MRIVHLILVGLLTFALTDTSRANSVETVHSAQEVVVLTASEGIIYARFCGFYEMRDLIAEGLLGPASDEGDVSQPQFEIRVLGPKGESVVFVGDHWIRSEDGVFLLPSPIYDRIAESVSSRKGEGVPLARVDAINAISIQKYKSAGYKEVNRCSS